MRYLILCLLVLGCDISTPSNPTSAEKSLEGTFIERYENEEVICYLRYQHGMQCKFKELK